MQICAIEILNIIIIIATLNKGGAKVICVRDARYASRENRN